VQLTAQRLDELRCLPGLVGQIDCRLGDRERQVRGILISDYDWVAFG
jgi:hypothetical protein